MKQPNCLECKKSIQENIEICKFCCEGLCSECATSCDSCEEIFCHYCVTECKFCKNAFCETCGHEGTLCHVKSKIMEDFEPTESKGKGYKKRRAEHKRQRQARKANRPLKRKKRK